MSELKSKVPSTSVLKKLPLSNPAADAAAPMGDNAKAVVSTEVSADAPPNNRPFGALGPFFWMNVAMLVLMNFLKLVTAAGLNWPVVGLNTDLMRAFSVSTSDARSATNPFASDRTRATL